MSLEPGNRGSVRVASELPIPVAPLLTHVDDRKRFVMLVAGIFTAAAIAANYGFNIFSDHLKEKYNLDQSQLAIISTIGSMSSAFNFPSGCLFDYAGPRAAIGIPCIVGTAGLVFLGFTFRGLIPGSVVTFSIANSILCLGTANMDTGSLMTNIFNFPRDRGAVVALQKTFTGLGSSMLVVWYRGFFAGAYDMYAFFVAAEVLLFGMMGALLIELPPYQLTVLQRRRATDEELLQREATRDIYMTQRPSGRRFIVGYVVLFTMIIFLSSQSVLVVYYGASDRTRLIIACAVVFLLGCFLVMALPVRWLDGGGAVVDQAMLPPVPEVSKGDASYGATHETGDDIGLRAGLLGNDMERTGVRDSSPQEEYFSETPQRNSTRRSYANTLPAPPLEKLKEPQYTSTFMQDLKGADIWLLLLTSFCNWGCGNVVVLNSAQIYRSMNNNQYDENTNALYVALIGVGSALGRVAMGFTELWLDSRAYAQARKAAERRQERATRQREGNAEVDDNELSGLATDPLAVDGDIADAEPFLITVMYPLPSILISLGFLIFMFIPSHGIIVPFVMITFGFGFSWACTALSVRAMFEKDVGKHYNFCFLGSLTGTVVMNRFVFGELFDREARHNGTYPQCSGVGCVRNAFLIMLVLNVVGMISASAVHIRFKRFVKSCRNGSNTGLLLQE